MSLDTPSRLRVYSEMIDTVAFASKVAMLL